MKNKRHERRVKRLALIVTLCTIILAVSTYAWFVGMRTVSVSSFDVQIAATEGLSLSLDGKTWNEEVNINSTTYKTAYNGNTNTWGGDGLIPVSSIGKIDTASSRLVMYEKGSLTVTKGGYRLLASKVKNNTVVEGQEEGTGFVAFDLFIKNLSGKEYYTDFDVKNEEAIYLTQESTVDVVNSGSGDPQNQTGIENSVRVAFAQIGRVKADTTSETIIQGIKCTGSDSSVTASCGKDATIWEPNDKAHVQNAINWFANSCKTRAESGTDIYATASYTGTTCTAIADNTYYNTYAIGEEIKSTAEGTTGVDVYDGYNGFYGTIAGGKEGTTSTITGPLHKFDYFTDTEKMQTGLNRPQFFSLAPNSITKVRVYVYIEGQDIDNYDFASLGKAIKVNFGFTKERFFAGDIDYVGPETVTKEVQTGEDQVITVPKTQELAS